MPRKKSKKEILIFEIIIDHKTYGILHIVVLRKYYNTSHCNTFENITKHKLYAALRP